uniref:Claudin 34 n=1 Tax=Salarias fasciatus TaxID=181472 RepID=A0A672HYQ8_SALFA
MLFLARTAHGQFLGLIVGFLGWILILATAGLNEWRLWFVSDVSVINSGVAWVGIWRACFYSHILSDFENCQSFSISDSFLPVEIPVAQVLMMLSGICGLAANVAGGLAMRMAYFSVKDRRYLRLLFLLAAVLYLLTATLSLVPLVWNMTSVLNNSTIAFPPEYYLPSVPKGQAVGSAIAVGIVASIMMLISSLIFFCYRHVWESLSSEIPKVPPNNRITVINAF